MNTVSWISIRTASPCEEAVTACSCPRSPGTTLSAPLCPVEDYLPSPSGRSASLFVDAEALGQRYCGKRMSFGFGALCTCARRLQVFKRYGI